MFPFLFAVFVVSAVTGTVVALVLARPGPSRTPESGAVGPTGNTAFDDWHATEEARLRRTVREFGEFRDEERRAADRADLDAFRARRRADG